MFSMLFARRKPATRDYVRRCRKAVRAGRPIPEPATIDELFEALTRFPRQARRYRPSVFDLRGMRLPARWPNQEAGR